MREVIYPAAGGKKVPKDLVAEIRAADAAFARSKREVFKSSYSNHYRAGLMNPLEVLDFRSSNDRHKPVVEALIERHKDSTTNLPLGKTVPLDGVARKTWMESTLHTPDNRPPAGDPHRVRGVCLPGSADGDFISDLPVNSVIQPVDLPSTPP